ncbi:MAG: hypothetical protein HWN66_16590 [Candidatus Helarchaeota archaeon]|nr:hypothetical protein [Candidatus Helarchaeota archaeon]
MIYKISFNGNRNKQIEQAIKVLTSWIGKPDSNSNRSFTFLTMQNNSEEIENLSLEQVDNLKKRDDFLISFDKNEVQNEEGEIFLLAVGDRGLANGIYYLYMKLRDYQTRDPFSINWNDFQTPHFETRGLVLNFPFSLDGLSTDTWSLSQWKEYLNRIRSFNYTSVEFLIGTWMLFHPDIDELKKNSWRYDLFEAVFQYAAEIGLEIVLLVVFNQIHPDLWIKYPEIRATIWGYQGISYCSQKGKEIGEKILKYTLNRFKHVPSNSLFAFEGGGCNCESCRKNIVDLIVKYLELIKENAEPERLFFITWFANFKENFETPAIKGLRDKLFSKIPKDVKIADVNRKTLQMAADQGYEIFDFIFFIDPEAGMENQAIFPRPHLNLLKERILDSIQEFGLRLKGVIGYRIIPKARFINDYALGRYLWNPEIEVEDIVSEIAGLLSSSIKEKEQITNAILLLEDFWRHLDKNKLKECKRILKTVTKQQKNVPEPLKSIQETIIILNLLFKYYSLDSERRKQGIIQKIFHLMKEMDTFHCYTTYKGWDSVSIEIIKQRVQWWTDPKSGLFNPKSLPWNSLSKAKYHLIDNKKDVLPWMTFSEIVSSAKLVISQKLKNFFKKLRKKN